jgi:hypothetical protein
MNPSFRSHVHESKVAPETEVLLSSPFPSSISPQMQSNSLKIIIRVSLMMISTNLWIWCALLWIMFKRACMWTRGACSITSQCLSRVIILKGAEWSLLSSLSLSLGTLGTKGSTQVVVPFVTENYGASR